MPLHPCQELNVRRGMSWSSPAQVFQINGTTWKVSTSYVQALPRIAQLRSMEYASGLPHEHPGRISSFRRRGGSGSGGSSPTGHSASCRRRLSSPPRQGTRPRWFRTTAATVATPRRMRACWRLLRNCSPTGGRAPPQRSQFSRPTADEARVAAAAEGLALVPSSSNEFGFRGVVRKQSGKYQALFKGNDLRLRHLGTFTTSQRRHPCTSRGTSGLSEQQRLRRRPCRVQGGLVGMGVGNGGGKKRRR